MKLLLIALAASTTLALPRCGGTTGAHGGTARDADPEATSSLLQDAPVLPVMAASLSAAKAASWPTSPPAQICGNAAILDGPSTAPAGAVVVPAGNNSGLFDRGPGTTYWFAPGVHTLNDGAFDQITPADDTSFIGAPGAIFDGRNKNDYAFTGTARHVRIAYLTIRNFGPGAGNNNEGVVNHDAGEGWTITNDSVVDNDGAGVFVGSGDIVANNCLKDNGQYGFSVYSPKGVRNIVIDHNEIAGNNTDDWETRIKGCGCTGGGKFWDTIGAVVTDNWVHDNKSVGLWADTDNADFRFEGNYIENNDAEGLFYEISYNALIRHNTLKRNALVKGRGFARRGDNFPVAAIYLSESGGDGRVGTQRGTLRVVENYLEDNYGGITLWENADRFCNSPANTSSGYCTLVPGTTKATCARGSIGQSPYYDDCRWKTQNVEVRRNEFRSHPKALGCKPDFCARNSVLSNYGTYPDWSPYKGETVEDAISLRQHNLFGDNKYAGPWRFTVHDTGRTVDFTAWQGSPYNQDAGSTLR